MRRLSGTLWVSIGLWVTGCQVAPTTSLDGPTGAIELAIITDAIPSGLVRSSYQVTIDARGPEGVDYVWAATGLPDGLSLLSTGFPQAVIQGIPTRAGRFDVQIVVQAAGASTRRFYIVEVRDPLDALEINIVADTPLFVGVPSEIVLQAEGAVGQPVWTVVSGGIPGMTLVDPFVGLYVGTPQEAGTFTLTIQATDDTGRRGEQTATLTVVSTTGPLTIDNTTLPPATTGVAYDEPLSASGGRPPYTWTAIDEVPDGLTLDPEGTPATRLSGFPSRPAFFSFVVEVRDSNGATATAEVRLRVDARRLTIVSETLPEGIETASYRAIVTAGGGTGAYAWRVAEGQLPPGLQLTPAGTPSTEIAGIPTAPGRFRFTLEVEDLAGTTVRRDFELVVDDVPVALTLVSSPIPSLATACLGFDAPVEVVGGSGGYTWSIDGVLPPGITLSAMNGPRVELSGAPTQADLYVFDVVVFDRSNASIRIPVRLDVRDDPTVARDISFGGQIMNGMADFYVADICGPSPSPAVQVTPANDRAESVGSARPLVSPDGQRLAFVGPVTPSPRVGIRTQARLYVLDLATGTPSPAVNLVPADAFQPFVSTFRWSPDSRKLAFRAQFNRDDDARLYIVDVTDPNNPGVPSALSEGEVVAGSDRWSPDSTTVAYVSDDRRTTVFEAFLAQLGRTVAAHPLPATGQGVTNRIVWRNDSGGIFFRGDLDDDETFALYHVQWDGRTAGELRRVSPDGVEDGDVTLDRFWLSPDGQWLTFVGDLDRDGSENVYAAPVTGGVAGAGMATAVNPPFARDREILGVEWSPTSDAIVIHGDLNQVGRFELFYASFAGGVPGGPTRLSPNLPNEGDVVSRPDTQFWSADGRWVGFLADARVDEKRELYVVDFDIPPPWQATRVSPDTADDRLDALRFEFAPDGSRMALLGDYAAADRFELWAIDLRGPAPGAAFRVHGDLPARATVKTTAEDTAWKTDGSALFFRADLTVAGRDELWMVDLTADGRQPPARVNPVPAGSGDVIRFGFTP